MLRMVNLLMALSLGVQREQLLQRMGLTWPRPFLLRPLGGKSVHMLMWDEPLHCVVSVRRDVPASEARSRPSLCCWVLLVLSPVDKTLFMGQFPSRVGQHSDGEQETRRTW